MKILRKILYVLAALLALGCAFIVFCAVRPDVTARLKDALYENGTASAESRTTRDDAYAAALADIEEAKNNDGGTAQDNGGAETSREETAQESADPERAGLRSDNAADYVAPRESDIVVPEAVQGKNGYQQIESDARQIDEADADDIRNQLDCGHTGDGLDFDAVYYPYYAMLDDAGRHIYRQIYANAEAVYPTFAPVEGVTSKQLRNIFEAVYNDHPELFWVETAYGCKYISSGQCVEIDLSFNRTAQELDGARSAFDGQVNDIVAGAQGLSGDYEKEKYVHDRLLDLITYNAGAEMNQSAYSALVNGQTVCAGYARAFQHIMQKLGIPCYYCTGFAGESHAWNIVSLDDGFYNVDATWDDSAGGTYDYFNRTDDDYADSHIRQELSVYLPPCRGRAHLGPERSETSAAGGESALRSVYETGVSKDHIFTDIDSYYRDCYDQIMRNGMGDYTFSNVVTGEELAAEIMESYASDAYKEAYMQQALDELGAGYSTWEIVPEPLQGGMYLLTHTMHMRQ